MADSTETRTTVTVTVNGRAVEAQPGELLIEVAERAGTYIPRFCYHPRMESVGVCRMCLVEVDGPRGATLQPSCYVGCTDGMVVNTESEKVKKAQDGVLEFLLANHPLDCPVCDKGGECPLQDQTLAHGSGETRFIEEKRHFAKPIEIGELVLLDRERCIQCSRCTRFADEVAGDAAINFAGRGELIEVAPFPTKPFDSVFSGNTVQICPVGALTAKPYRFAARPWDLEQVESTCTTCSVGCRVAVQSSGNRLTRVLGVDSDPVNHGWLCDKGRFVIEAVDAEGTSGSYSDPATRLREPLVRRNGTLEPATWGEALAAAAAVITEATSTSTDGFGAIGGAALTNEGAFAFERLLRGVIGTEHVDAQYGDGLDPVLLAAIPRATIDEAAAACTVVLLTGDLREELPVLFLRLRAGAVKGTMNIVEIATASNALRSLSRVTLPTRPGEAHLVARAIANDAAAMAQLATHPQGAAFGETELNEVRRLLGDTGEGVVFVVGRPNAAESALVIESAIRTLASEYPEARFLPTLRRGNVFGALDMGLAPGLRPGRAAGSTGRGTIAQLHALVSGEQKAVLVLGGDLISNVPDQALAKGALAAARVIAVTGHGGATVDAAEVVLPVSVTHERWGTVTNLEGRVTAVAPKLVSPGSTWSDVAIAAELAEELGQTLGLDSVEATSVAIETTTGYPASTVLSEGDVEGFVVGREGESKPRRPLDPIAFPGIRSADLVGLAPRAGAVQESVAGSSVSVARVTSSDVSEVAVPSLALADAYALRVVATRRLYDRGEGVLGTPALRTLIPATTVRANPYDLDRLGVTTGDVVRATTARGSFTVAVRVDADVVRGTAEVHLNTVNDEGVDVVGTLVIDADAIVSEIRLESR